MSDKPKLNIGDTAYYVDSSIHYGVTDNCKMCFGNRYVSIILGNGEKIDPECGFCSHGFESPSGLSKTWEANSVIKCGIITGISTDFFKESVWTYQIDHRSLLAHELFRTQEEAIPSREEKLREVKKQREEWVRDNFITATKQQIWSTGYHKSCIQNNEKSISWHKMRIGMIRYRSKAVHD